MIAVIVANPLSCLELTSENKSHLRVSRKPGKMRPMIKVTIRQAARRRGLKNAYQFGQSIGVADMVAARIWEGVQLPKLKTLDRICNAWGCGLDELIAYKRDASPNGHTSPVTPKKQIGTKTKAGKLSASRRGR